jgi:hypothetical protein
LSFPFFCAALHRVERAQTDHAYTRGDFDAIDHFARILISRKENGAERECVCRMSREKSKSARGEFLLRRRHVRDASVRARPCRQVHASCFEVIAAVNG